MGTGKRHGLHGMVLYEGETLACGFSMNPTTVG